MFWNNHKPEIKFYEHKVKKNILYIYSQTILHPQITGEELSHNIKELFGETITPQYTSSL